MTSGPTLHIFNPETDFALGADGDNYTPKANIVDLRRRLALLPAIWARPGDSILLLDRQENIDTSALRGKDIELLTLNEIRGREFAGIKPWGWNPTLRRILLQSGVGEELLPSQRVLANLRRVAHRRTTIPFHKTVGTPSDMLPREITDLQQAMKWAEEHPGGYIKAPWSSSGRGVHRAHPGDETTLRRWLVGTLRRQGSVIVEPDWRQSLDFATEWILENGSARFIGYSLFEVDTHCQYKANASLTQSEIEACLEKYGWSTHLLEQQSAALEQIVVPLYSGPLGIDALYSPAFGFNLCVEINPRMTMGVVNLLKNHEIPTI